MTPTTPGALQNWAQEASSLIAHFERAQLRIDWPEAGIVRVRLSPHDHFDPARSWELIDALAPEHTFTVEESEGALTLHGAALTLTVARDGRVTLADGEGRPFAADLEPPSWAEADVADFSGLRHRPGDALPPGPERLAMRARMALDPAEHLYGFGQRTGLLERRNRRFSNWTIDPAQGHLRGHDNLYQAHPTFMALRPGLAWGCFLHVSDFSDFDVGTVEHDVLTVRALGGELDRFYFFGPTPATVLERLTRLTGRPAMPPLWALGFHQSRWGYRSADEMRELAAQFAARDLPIDVLHFDIDYMRGYRDFTWEPERFPEPAALLAELREQGIRAVTIVDPGVKADLSGGYEVAESGLAEGAFIRNPDGSPFIGFCWPDSAFFPDFASERARAWWGEQHRALLDAGVAGIWNDMNEPAIFDRPFSVGSAEQLPMPLATPQGEGEERTTHAELHNLYALHMARATYEGLRRLRPDARPWILTRSGFTGIQRYATSWMGDNNSWWEHLEMSMPQLASMGLGGSPFVGVDIGGFFDSPSPELFARWIELGTFYPFMRVHTCAGTAPQEPWSFGPEVEEVARASMRLRYRLLPYLYTLAHEAHRSGAPLLRPMLYDFPDDRATYHRHDQLMVGPWLLVAPIYHPGVEHRIVYLPEGRWHDFWAKGMIEGPAHVAVHAPLGRIPLFVRGGAVLPLGNVRRSTNAPLSELTVALYPAGASEGQWIEDDGETMAFERGEIAVTRVAMREEEGAVRVRIAPRAGSFVPAPRTLALRLHLPTRPESVTVDGEAREVEWDEALGAATVRWEDDGAGHEVVAR